MNVTIRNIDRTAYRRIKARAAIEGKTVGELISDAIRAFAPLTPLESRKGPGPRKPARRPGKAPSGPRDQEPGPFVRPPPRWGAFVDDPMVIFEIEPEP